MYKEKAISLEMRGNGFIINSSEFIYGLSFFISFVSLILKFLFFSERPRQENDYSEINNDIRKIVCPGFICYAIIYIESRPHEK